MRNYALAALLLLVGLLAVKVFSDQPPRDDDTVNLIIKAKRACEAQMGERCR